MAGDDQGWAFKQAGSPRRPRRPGWPAPSPDGRSRYQPGQPPQRANHDASRRSFRHPPPVPAEPAGTGIDAPPAPEFDCPRETSPAKAPNTPRAAAQPMSTQNSRFRVTGAAAVGPSMAPTNVTDTPDVCSCIAIAVYSRTRRPRMPLGTHSALAGPVDAGAVFDGDDRD